MVRHYRSIIYLTYHQHPDALDDSIRNILHFMPDSFIVVNNGPGDDLTHLNGERVHIIEDSFRIEYYDTMIPMHIVMTDYILKNNITADKIVLISSNQLFIRHGFDDFMMWYGGGYFEREKTCGFQTSVNEEIFKKVYDKLKHENFKFQSNHDGMFFNFNEFVELMKTCEEYRGVSSRPHHEEYIYPAMLFNKHSEKELAEFKIYNHFCWIERVEMNHLEEALMLNKYLIKRVERNVQDSVRKHLREKNGY